MKQFMKSLIFPLALVVAALAASVAASVNAHAQDAKALCEKADEFFEQGKVADAKKTLEQAKGASPNSYDVLWRMSRAMLLTGDGLPDKSSQQEKTYYDAKYFADEAIKANPNGSQGYVRRAGANGKIALFKGVLGAKESVNAVREDAQKALSLNSDGPLAAAAAHYILGRTHLKLTETPKPMRMPIGLGWGNMDEALSNLKKAVELRSDFIQYRFEYARALVKKEQYADARNELQKIATLRYQDFNDDVRKKDAAQLLQEIQAK
jgi:tetratricopeptide (TPR) repeat protein